MQTDFCNFLFFIFVFSTDLSLSWVVPDTWQRKGEQKLKKGSSRFRFLKSQKPGIWAGVCGCFISTAGSKNAVSEQLGLWSGWNLITFFWNMKNATNGEAFLFSWRLFFMTDIDNDAVKGFFLWCNLRQCAYTTGIHLQVIYVHFNLLLCFYLKHKENNSNQG